MASTCGLLSGSLNQVVGGSGLRRVELIEAAFHRIAAGGLEGLRLRQVAEDVGIDHSTLHHHVATKQDLIAGVVGYTLRQFRATMPEDGDPAARLHGHLARLRQMMAEQPDLFVVSAELDLRARRDPVARAAIEAQEAGWRAGLAGLFAAGRQAGIWADAVDPHAAAEAVIAAVKGVRLTPDLAAPVFDQLAALLVQRAPATRG